MAIFLALEISLFPSKNSIFVGMAN